MGKSFTDCFVCHRGNPETFEGLFISSFIEDPAGDELTFTACIRGDNDIRDIFSENLFFDRVILTGCLPDHDQLPMLRKHGKSIHAPGFVLFPVFFRVSQCDQMTQSPCDNIIVSFYIGITLFAASEYTGDIPRDGRFFCYNKMFHLYTSPFL